MFEHDDEWGVIGAADDRTPGSGKQGSERMKQSVRYRGRSANSEKAARRFQPVDDLVKRFFDREGGAVTVEFVLWLPLLLAVLLVAVDASVLYMRQSNLWQVSRDTARIVSRHAMDEQTAETYAVLQSKLGSTIPTVDVQIAGPLVTVRMAADLAELAPIGILNFALTEQLSAEITHALEPR